MRKAFKWLLGYWSRFSDLLLPNKNQQKEVQSDLQSQPTSNLYYSIPGKAFTGSISKGHILKIENKWPLKGK
jgi:hypothetical protein